MGLFDEIPAPMSELPAPMMEKPSEAPPSRWLDFFWREPAPGGSQIDDLVFQVRRDLAALEDGPDEFLTERVASYRALIRRLMARGEV